MLMFSKQVMGLYCRKTACVVTPKWGLLMKSRGLSWYTADTFSPNRVTTNSFNLLCCERIATTQQIKTVVLWLGLGKKWPLCTTDSERVAAAGEGPSEWYFKYHRNICEKSSYVCTLVRWNKPSSRKVNPNLPQATSALPETGSLHKRETCMQSTERTNADIVIYIFIIQV